MEEKENKATLEQKAQEGTEKQGGWRGLLGKRKPGLDLEDDEAVGSYLTDELGRLDRNDETNRKMNELIMEDKRNAGLLSGIFNRKDENGEPFKLVDFIVKSWWKEIKGATEAEEAIAMINKRIADEEKEAADKAKRKKEVEDNFEKMNAALGSALKKTGVDNATAQKMIDWLYGTDEEDGLYVKVPKHSLDEDDFVKLIHAFTRDKSLEEARSEGMAEGRKARPSAVHRSQTAKAMTDLGGGGGGDLPSESPDQNPTATRYTGMKPRFNQ